MPLPSLANAELAIMELLWDQDALTARAIKERLYPSAKSSQHGTVQRLLQRLERKGFVERDRSLGVHRFSPALTREIYAASQLESLTQKLTGGSLAPLITHLLEEEKLSSDEIARLRRALDGEDTKGDEP
jgi:predicted transcriptional regulator